MVQGLLNARATVVLACALVVLAACGSSRTAGKQGSAGRGGTSAGSPASGGMAGGTSGTNATAGSGGASVGGRSAGSSGTGGGAGAVSTAGSDQGGAPPEPAAGGAPQGGSSTAGNAPTSGRGGDAGAAGEGGSAGSPELEVGTASVDLVVSIGDRSSRVTHCDATTTTRDSTLSAPYPNGTRVGYLACAPEREGGVDVFQLFIVALSSALGEHAASELDYDCSSPDGCVGVGTVAAFVNTQVVNSSDATAKSGTFTLDELNDSGRMAGSLDLTLANPSVEVRIVGTFEANLLDCTTLPDEMCPE